MRSAHSLAAHPDVDEVVVIGPAKSRNFKVVADAGSCDYIVGSGDEAAKRARRLGVPLIWDQDDTAEGVVVWGASPRGLTLAMAARESEPRLVALAHPAEAEVEGRVLRFPDPVGEIAVADRTVGGQPLAVGRSPGEFASCLVRGVDRSVTVVDHGGFMAGIALAAGVTLAARGPMPVWAGALEYLQTATTMGLLMGEA